VLKERKDGWLARKRIEKKIGGRYEEVSGEYGKIMRWYVERRLEKGRHCMKGNFFLGGRVKVEGAGTNGDVRKGLWTEDVRCDA